MSFPAEGLESTYRNHIEDVRAYLESRKKKYIVVNVSGRSYNINKFGPNVKVFDGGSFWKLTNRPPPLKSIFFLCDAIQKWMAANQNRLTVIHCMVHILLLYDYALILFNYKCNPLFKFLFQNRMVKPIQL